jgi:hypothetical protein
MLLKLLRMRRKSWKRFHKLVSRNISNNSTVAGRNVQLHEEIIWRKFGLNDCSVQYFWEMKLFHEHFEANLYVVTCNVCMNMFHAQYICAIVLQLFAT